MTLLGLLVALIVIGVVFWAARAIIAAFAIPQPIATVIYVIMVLIVLFWLLQQLGLNTGLRLSDATMVTEIARLSS